MTAAYYGKEVGRRQSFASSTSHNWDCRTGTAGSPIVSRAEADRHQETLLFVNQFEFLNTEDFPERAAGAIHVARLPFLRPRLVGLGPRAFVKAELLDA